jgi:hypothetical protein
MGMPLELKILFCNEPFQFSQSQKKLKCPISGNPFNNARAKKWNSDDAEVWWVVGRSN